MKYMHFKYDISLDDFTKEEINSFELNEDNYNIYSHFMLLEYKNSDVHQLSMSDNIPLNTYAIDYYVGNECVAKGSVIIKSDFKCNKKYEMRELLLFDLFK